MHCTDTRVFCLFKWVSETLKSLTSTGSHWTITAWDTNRAHFFFKFFCSGELAAGVCVCRPPRSCLLRDSRSCAPRQHYPPIKVWPLFTFLLLKGRGRVRLIKAAVSVSLQAGETTTTATVAECWQSKHSWVLTHSHTHTHERTQPLPHTHK